MIIYEGPIMVFLQEIHDSVWALEKALSALLRTSEYFAAIFTLIHVNWQISWVKPFLKANFKHGIIEASRWKKRDKTWVFSIARPLFFSFWLLPLTKGSHPEKKSAYVWIFSKRPWPPPPVFLERFEELFKTLFYMS